MENERAALDLFQRKFKNRISIHAFNRIAEYAWSICHGVSSVARILEEGREGSIAKAKLTKDLRVLNARSAYHSINFPSHAAMYVLYKLFSWIFLLCHYHCHLKALI